MTVPVTPDRRRPPPSPYTAGADSTYSATSTTSFLPSSAPTPFNTFLQPSADYDPDTPTRHTQSSRGDDLLYSPGDDVSLRPSLSNPSSQPSRMPSVYSSHASSHLLPYTSRATSFQSGTISIPHSDRPIPDPPMLRDANGQIDSKSFDQPPSPPLVSFSSRPDLESATLGTASSASGPLASKWNWKRRRGSKGKQDQVDAQRLRQLGYDAVLGREYSFWSSLSISTLNIGCLQGTIYAMKAAYSYGGPQMLLVAWPVSGVFTLFLTLTLSELASAYPVSGAMASWAWKCARGGVGGEREWGWLLGGFVLGGHSSSAILIIWEICDIIAGTMGLSFDYHVRNWHEVMFYLAICILLGCMGMTAWAKGHRFWLGAGIYGLSIWFILCVSLLATGVRRNGTIRTDMFFNNSGWSSRTYVYLLGWEFSTIASGMDASAHMAEETKNPSRNVPNAMTMSVILTYVLGYISIILLLLSIGPEAVSQLTHQPFAFGYILTTAISHSGAIAICCLLIVVLFVQVLAQVQASSRFIFALARDNALPFSETIRRTNAKRQPVVANWLAIGLCLPFSLLLIGGKTTLYSVLAVAASSLSYVGYVVPIILYLLSGKDLQQEGRTSWSLRRWSKPCACIGVVYAAGVIVCQTLPGSSPVNAQSISWSPVLLVGTAIVGFITWLSYGNKHYSGPIRALTKWETGVEIDLQSTLGPRSKPTDNAPAVVHSEGEIQHGHTDDSKLGIAPYLSEVPSIMIGSARTVEEETRGEWAEFNEGDSGGITIDATESTSSAPHNGA